MAQNHVYSVYNKRIVCNLSLFVLCLSLWSIFSVHATIFSSRDCLEVYNTWKNCIKNCYLLYNSAYVVSRGCISLPILTVELM